MFGPDLNLDISVNADMCLCYPLFFKLLELLHFEIKICIIVLPAGIRPIW